MSFWGCFRLSKERADPSFLLLVPASQETVTTEAPVSGDALFGDLLLFLDPPVFSRFFACASVPVCIFQVLRDAALCRWLPVAPSLTADWSSGPPVLSGLLVASQPGVMSSGGSILVIPTIHYSSYAPPGKHLLYWLFIGSRRRR